jgi:DGQHR domain-containing protein
MKIKTIGDKKYIYLLGNKMEQPIGSLYSSSIEAKVLKDISFTNPRVLVGLADNGEEIYRGIQRSLSPERVKQIKKYVNEYEFATFPSSIILNFPHEKVDIYNVDVNININSSKEDRNFNIEFEGDGVKGFSKMVLLIFPYEESIAQIIDGQHRMSGFKDNKNLDFDLPITIFIDQTVEQQAEIFSTINGKQTRVTPSLVYELFGISERPSPYKTAHNIVKVLNGSDESPLKGWFKRLGKANKYYEGYITQSTANQNILKLLCGNAKQVDEDLRTLSRDQKLTIETPFSRTGAVLREFYIEDDEISIIKILFNFFSAIKQILPDQWNEENSILKKTIGFTALFKVLNELVVEGLKTRTLSKDFFISMLSGVKINKEITISSKGVNELYQQFHVYYKDKLTG